MALKDAMPVSPFVLLRHSRESGNPSDFRFLLDEEPDSG
jgi:hypothetical protein